MPARATVVGVLASLTLLACPPSDKRAPPGPEAQGCARVGQSCEVSPGKLGTCVLRDACEGPPSACFTCQSQH